MSGLAQPLWLVALPVWALAVALLWRYQLPAVAWLRRHSAPEDLPQLTRYARGSGQRRHFFLLFLSGAFLAFAAAGPYRVAEGQQRVAQRAVIVLLDASLSMGATDIVREAVTATATGEVEKTESRLARSKRFVHDLAEALPEASLALISFSGTTVVHSPPTRDHRALLALLDSLGIHVDLTRSGTAFSSAFAAAVHLAEGQPALYQALMISDGELPREDAYDDPLTALEELGVPVHAVGVGTLEGQSRVIYDPEDLRNNVEEKRVAQEYHTRRDDQRLAEIAERTGGLALLADDASTIPRIAERVRAAEPVARDLYGAVRHDLAPLAVAAFLVTFLIDTLGFGRPRRRLVGAVALVVLVGCQSRLLDAYRLDREGREHFNGRRYLQAAASFEQSLAMGFRRHIPLYNLGTTDLELAALQAAHERFEQALTVHPRHAPTHYNDGHALFRWGEEELDAPTCRVERTRQLWEQALARFQRAAELGGGVGGDAEADARRLEQRLAELHDIEDACNAPPPPPPPDSPPPPPPPSGGGGGEGKGDGDGEPPPPPEGEGEGNGNQLPPPPPPPEGEGDGDGNGEPPPPPPEGDGDGDGDPPPPPPEGDGGGNGDAPPHPPAGLSDDERDQIQAALDRIRADAASGSFAQSLPEQYTPEMLEAASGLALWW